MSIPLRRKNEVWPIEDAEPGVSASLLSECCSDSRTGGVCCKELYKPQRTLIDPDVVRDVIIGLSDGLTVPFALTAGLSSLGESRLVVLGGIAELIAGAISMGIGGFLASQAERDHYRYLHKQTQERIRQTCAGQLEREVTGVLAPVGVDEKSCRAVANCLREIEEDDASSSSSSSTGDAEDVGITAFLLKFGQGLEQIPTIRLYVSALTIGMGYLTGGLIPLIPYFFIPSAHIALIYSCIITGMVLLIFGAVKAHVTGAGIGIGGYIWGAVNTLMVGGLAAGAAFGIVRLLEGREE